MNKGTRIGGSPPRPWLRLRFLDPNGQPVDVTLIADTGCPYPVIFGTNLLDALTRIAGTSVGSNFGPLQGGWVRLAMPDFGIDQDVLCYGSPTIALAVALDDPSFQGLVGLPVLQLAEYGGNATDFWFRSLATTTPGSHP